MINYRAYRLFIFIYLFFIPYAKAQHSIGVNTGVFKDVYITESKLYPPVLTLISNVYYSYTFGQNENLIISSILGFDLSRIKPNWDHYDYYIANNHAYFASIMFGYKFINAGRHSLIFHVGPTLRSLYLIKRTFKEINKSPTEESYWRGLRPTFFGSTILIDYKIGLGNGITLNDYPFELSVSFPITYFQSEELNLRFFRFTPSIGIQWNFGSGNYF
jgi:hypothetical protein